MRCLGAAPLRCLRGQRAKARSRSLFILAIISSAFNNVNGQALAAGVDTLTALAERRQQFGNQQGVALPVCSCIYQGIGSPKCGAEIAQLCEVHFTAVALSQLLQKLL